MNANVVGHDVWLHGTSVKDAVLTMPCSFFFPLGALTDTTCSCTDIASESLAETTLSGASGHQHLLPTKDNSRSHNFQILEVPKPFEVVEHGNAGPAIRVNIGLQVCVRQVWDTIMQYEAR